MKTFHIIPENSHSYDVQAEDNATVDTVWLSEKAWFMTGREVIIVDRTSGDIKLFVKGEN